MAPTLVSLLFLAITFSFGYVCAVLVLQERRAVAVVPIAAIIGVNGYTFLVNLIGYFVPIERVFWIVPGAMLAAALGGVLLLCRRREPLVVPLGIPLRHAVILFAAAALIAAVTGSVALRTLADSDLKLGHAPLAATIAAGNFPVMDPSAPDHLVAYHYGPDLLTAALGAVAGVPWWLGYDLQTFFFAMVAFLMAFVLAAYLVRDRFRPAFLAALLFAYGGGLSWLHFVDGIAPLWRKFVLGLGVFAPWKFVPTMIIPRFDSSIVLALNHTVLMGTPVMLLALYCYFRTLEPGAARRYVLTAMAGLLLGHLALSLETNFLIVLAALLVVLAARFLWPRVPGSWRERCVERAPVLTAVTLAIIAIGTVVAFTQGGILATLGSSGESQAIAVVKHFWTSDITDKGILPFRGKFFLEFGLPLLLFIPLLVFYRRYPRVLFIGLIAAGAFTAPLLFHYTTRPREMERLFSISTPLFSFLAGLFLGDVAERFGSGRKAVRWLIAAAVGSMVLTAVLFQAVHLVTPPGYIGKFTQPFLATPPPLDPLDTRAYEWVREHTTLADRFFPYSNDFIMYTARFTPGFFNAGWGYPDELAAYQSIIDSCSPLAFRKLGITYLYVSPHLSVKNFTTGCLPKLGAALVYADGRGGDFRGIYRLNGSESGPPAVR